ncbi:MAG: site-2 protease family protein [Ruminococcus sp.]
MGLNDFFQYFARILTLLLVLPVHEAAHGLVAKWFGDDTAEREGRITLNPMAHLDLFGSLLIIFTGFGWAKPVPINPMRMKKYRAGISLTALAGPVSNILAALVSGLIYNLMMCSQTVVNQYYEYNFGGEVTPLICLLMVLSFLFQINIGLAVFNLIPIPPLDGFNVLRYFTSEKVDRWFYTYQREISMGLLILLVLLRIIPSEYNFISIIAMKFSDLLWHAVSWIPKLKWGL